jgi:predicted methyltransferase
MKTKLLIAQLLISAFIFIAPSTLFAAHHGEEQVKKHSLGDILDAQDDSAKARYEFRNPKETIEFFGIEPGMKVAEALPGGGWYSKILLPLLGQDGHLLGVDYSLDMWPHFGGFATAEFIEKRKTWTTTWTEGAQEWRGDDSADVSAVTFATMPEDLDGTLDAVVFIRALHNLARFSEQGDYLGNAISASFKALKPGGIVGIVQHQAREDRPDSWADGSNGYLKKSMIMSAMKAAGFEFVAESSINENAKDQATEGDIVWRLPPSFGTSGDDEELKAKMTAIGESNRMTLKFRKPLADS